MSLICVCSSQHHRESGALFFLYGWVTKLKKNQLFISSFLDYRNGDIILSGVPLVLDNSIQYFLGGFPLKIKD